MMGYEALHADLRASMGHVAIPPSECLNGCQQGNSDQRGPVLCQDAQRLCTECVARLGKWLRALPDSVTLLPAVLDHGTVPADPGTKHTKRADPPAPMRLEVTDLLDDRPIWTRDDNGVLIQTENRRGALGLLHDWARRIRHDRLIQTRCGRCQHETGRHKWAPPLLAHCRATHCNCSHYEVPVPTIASECSLILANLPWCVEQEWAGDLYDEIRQLDRTLTDTLGDYRAKPVGSCAELGERPGVLLPVLCGGALVMDREGHGVRCTRCGTEIAADEGLRALGLIVGQMFGDNRINQEAS